MTRPLNAEAWTLDPPDIDYRRAGISVHEVNGVYVVFQDERALDGFPTFAGADEHATERYLDLVDQGLVGGLNVDEDLIPAGFEYVTVRQSDGTIGRRLRDRDNLETWE